MKNKLLVVGWDAADWSLMMPLIQSGKMPATAELMNRGFYGKLGSIQPMLSPLLWTSIATGVRPHDHRILNFVEPDYRGNGVRAVRGTSRKRKTFWEILSERGLKSNVVGWWPSHPAESAGGISVSNFFQRGTDSGFEELSPEVISPREFVDDFSELRVHATELTSQILAPFFPNADELTGDDSVLSSVAKIVADASGIQAAVTEAMERTDWDITAVYFDAMDHFKHLAMAYHPPVADHVSEADALKYGAIVESGYRFHDMMLDRLIDLAGEDCHILLVSDHGFTTGIERLSSTPDLPGGPAAEHHPFGVLIGAGPSWKPGVVYGTSLLDVFPSILQLFGAPLPRDMAGRLPSEWWKDKPVPSFVDSYPIEHADSNEEYKSEKALLDDLSELGYVDLPTDDTEARKAVEGDMRYHEITSLVDGCRLVSALNKSDSLVLDFPNDARYAYQNLGLCLMANDPKWDDLVSRVTNKFPSPSAHYFRGMDALKHGFWQTAIDEFKIVLNTASNIERVALSMGKALQSAGRINEAISFLQEVEVSSPRLAGASVELAKIYLQQDRAEEALECALEAVGRLFYTPEAHRIIALSAMQLNEASSAETAFVTYLKMVPDDAEIKALYVKWAKEKGRELVMEWPVEKHEPTVIVTGWPRSGTSMMMQVLASAGLETYSDQQRASDEHNPKGYLEHDAIKRTHVDASWIDEAEGKVAKVLFPQFGHLPGDRRYVVIYMDRPLTEIITSQGIMMGQSARDIAQNFPFGKAMQMQADGEAFIQRAERSENMSLKRVSHFDCYQNTEVTIASVIEFLRVNGIEITKSAEELAPIVDQNLYRSGNMG